MLAGYSHGRSTPAALLIRGGGDYLMKKCSAITDKGARCKAIPMRGEQYCYVHHPDHAEDRRRHGSKGGKRGGRGRPISELAKLQGWFEELAEQVLDGELERAKAAVACQLLNGARSCVRDGLVAREKEELEARIEADAERIAAIESVLKIRSVK
jgi:hypothetical protein